LPGACSIWIRPVGYGMIWVSRSVSPH